MSPHKGKLSSYKNQMAISNYILTILIRVLHSQLKACFLGGLIKKTKQVLGLKVTFNRQFSSDPASLSTAG